MESASAPAMAHFDQLEFQIESPRDGRFLRVRCIRRSIERRGFVCSRLGAPTPEGGGKRKRLYTLQPAGERELGRVNESLRLMAGGMATRLRAIRS